MSDIDLAKIGNILKARRLEKNLSLRDLSARSDTAASTISQIETGKTSPNLLTLKALCNALDIPVFSLFMDDEISNVRLVRHNEQQTFIRNISNGKALVESLITQGKNEMWGAIVAIPAALNLENRISRCSPYHFGSRRDILLSIKQNTRRSGLKFRTSRSTRASASISPSPLIPELIISNSVSGYFALKSVISFSP